MKKWLVVILSMIIIVCGVGCYFILKNDGEADNGIIDRIAGYNYELEANATSLQKEEFSKLKKILEKEEVNDNEYASAVARLFIADLYTIDNKLNKYDVGGVSYVIPSALENYKLKVQDTLYKHLEDNTDGKRKQTLPVVNKIEIISEKETQYNIDDNEYAGFEITLKWEYDQDLGYDDETELIVIKSEKYYYVAEKK